MKPKFKSKNVPSQPIKKTARKKLATLANWLEKQPQTNHDKPKAAVDLEKSTQASETAKAKKTKRSSE